MGPKVVIITGPTAVGKTQLSLAIAKHFQTDLINGDAYQIYQKMDIATAKPTFAERNMIKHHLMDVIDPLENYSIFQYQKDVRNLIDQLTKDGKLPIIVGGSGLYIDSVIYDYRFTDQPTDPKELADLESLDNETLYQILTDLDPDKALQIHPNNKKRIIRAIILARSDQDQSERNQKQQLCYQPLIIFLNDDRQKLYQKINDRVDLMVKEGLFKEVESLFPDQLSTQALAGIGYKELFSHLRGEISFEQAIADIKQASRRYAKRQLSWFRNHPDVLIVEINREDFDQTIQYVIELIDKFID